jgi:tetratricopeptide (TPR) repeat protein
VITKDTGDIYYAARKYDRAIEYFRKTLEMDSNFVIARVDLALVYAQQREFSRALAELQKARQLQDDRYVLSEVGYVFALSGRRQEAQKVLSDLTVVSEQRYIFPTDYALIYAGLGDKDEAFEWLEKSYREGGLLVGLKVDPCWDNLRTDARFADLMKRVGLAP